MNCKVKHKGNSLWLEVWLRLIQNKAAVLGLIILSIMIFFAIFADILAPEGYDNQVLANASQSPSLDHIFGTDNLGRDILVRIIHGSRISLTVGIVSVTMSITIGGVLGSIAAFYGGRADNIIMRCLDIVMAIPGMLLAIAIAASLGPGLNNMMIAIGIGSVPGYARVVRASVLTVKDQEFVEAARSIGASDFQIILKHIIPNSLAPIIVQATLGVAGAILSAASLSFLGLGITPPIPEWGAMLSSARTYIRTDGYMSIFPGIAIMLTVYALNIVGDGLRDALDPRLKN